MLTHTQRVAVGRSYHRILVFILRGVRDVSSQVCLLVARGRHAPPGAGANVVGRVVLDGVWLVEARLDESLAGL